MVDADVVARKLLSLNEALRELERPAAASEASLAADPVLRAAVERWLQVALEACIDIAFHVVASEGGRPRNRPSTGTIQCSIEAIRVVAAQEKLMVTDSRMNPPCHPPICSVQAPRVLVPYLSVP